MKIYLRLSGELRARALEDIPSFLETFDIRTLKFYEKRGYELVASDDLLGVKGYWLLRE